MGTIQKGILGGFSGTVGTVIGGNWKGIDYMRSLSNRKSYTPTQAQLEQQLKFGLIMRFSQVFSGLLQQSFRNYATKMTGINAAFSYNLRNAVTGTFPAFSIDYPKALVSRGDLPAGINPTAAAVAGGKIQFSWTDDSGASKAQPTDLSILAVYCEDLSQCLYTMNGTERGTGAATFEAGHFAGKQVQTWLGFVSADGSLISNSNFTGALTVS